MQASSDRPKAFPVWKAGLPLLLLAVAPCRGADFSTITPAPRLGEWLEGLGSATPFTIEKYGKTRSRAAKDLAAYFSDRLPHGRLPAEGYLLEAGPRGAVAVVADDLGAIRAKQTVRQLPREPGAMPRLRIADWPDMDWRGIHVLDAGPGRLPETVRLIHEVLGARKCNVFVYEIDYNFKFVSHPEMAGGDSWTRTQVGEMVKACAEEGIRLIPEINCLGHQSWMEPPGRLLSVHPEFEEIPDGTIPQTRTGSGQFYCRSWCPRHPEIISFIGDLADELVDAFQSDSFHAGMDEVFVIGSDKCPRCRGLNTAELFAGAVKGLHDRLEKRGKGMLIWGDRLLDSEKTGYSDWDASGNGTAPAIGMIPKDIIICDWHYEYREDYPSLDIFPRNGFRVWPTTYSSLRGERKFMSDARKRKNRMILGVLTSIWTTVDQMAGAELEGAGIDVDRGSRNNSRTAVLGLEEAWAGEPREDPFIGPWKTTFLDAVTVTMTTSGRGSVVRYTTDGTIPGPSSTRYAGPITLTETAVIRAAVCRGKGVSVRTTTRKYEKLIPLEPENAGDLVPGINYAVYLAEGMEWESLPDFGVLKPDRIGTTAYFDLGLAPRHDRYGLAFTGYLDVPRDGLYKFTIASDDGSRVYLGDRMVADCDGLHQRIERSGEVALKAGKHAVKVLFMQGAGEAELEVMWEGPGIARQPVPASALWRR